MAAVSWMGASCAVTGGREGTRTRGWARVTARRGRVGSRAASVKKVKLARISRAGRYGYGQPPRTRDGDRCSVHCPLHRVESVVFAAVSRPASWVFDACAVSEPAARHTAAITTSRPRAPRRRGERTGVVWLAFVMAARSFCTSPDECLGIDLPRAQGTILAVYFAAGGSAGVAAKCGGVGFADAGALGVGARDDRGPEHGHQHCRRLELAYKEVGAVVRVPADQVGRVRGECDAATSVCHARPGVEVICAMRREAVGGDVSLQCSCSRRGSTRAPDAQKSTGQSPERRNLRPR